MQEASGKGTPIVQWGVQGRRPPGELLGLVHTRRLKKAESDVYSTAAGTEELQAPTGDHFLPFHPGVQHVRWYHPYAR